jgi:signal peptide peptidase SppA
MTSSLSHIAAMRLFDTPLAIHGGKLVAAIEALGPRLSPDGVTIEAASERVDHVAFSGGRPSLGRLGDPLGRRIAAQGDAKPYTMIGSLAVIGIEGTLIHKGKWIGAFSGSTSYEGVQAAVRAAAADEQVKGVVFEVDSFGGEVSGAFDTAAQIRALSGKKPTLAILTDHALSAGYLLASAAREISMPSSGRAGSIGVVMVHTDVSQAIANRGMKVTVLTAGKFKGEGNPYEPLGEATAKRIRADLETARRDFAAAVHQGRGKRMSVEAALATEADDFRGEDAAEQGLVDRVEHASDAFDAFAARINETASRSIFVMKGNGMSTNADAVAPTAADVTAAEAKGFAAGKTAGATEGAASAKARIKGILAHDAAKSRRALADKLAFDTDLSVEQAADILTASPEEARAGRLAAEMAGVKQPQLGSGVEAPPSDVSDFDKGAAEAKALLGKR